MGSGASDADGAACVRSGTAAMAVRRGAAFASLALAVHLGASAAAGRERCDVAHFAAAGCAPAAGARACLECVGQHQLALGARGCADADAQRYCGGAAAGPKTVFAHYMMCFHCFGNCTPGPSCSYQGASSYIEGYEAEMEIAQRFGLDGFALEWLGGNYYYNESYYNIFTACEVCGRVGVRVRVCVRLRLRLRLQLCECVCACACTCAKVCFSHLDLSRSFPRSYKTERSWWGRRTMPNGARPPRQRVSVCRVCVCRVCVSVCLCVCLCLCMCVVCLCL